MNRLYTIVVFLIACFAGQLIPAYAHAQILSVDQKAALEQELANVEAEQKQAEADLATARAQSASLSNSIAILDAQIKAAQLNIKAKTLLIQTLGTDIDTTQKHIDNLETHIDTAHQSISDILKKTYEIPDVSLPEIILSQSSVSGFFKDVDQFDSVHQSLQSTLTELKDNQSQAVSAKDALTNRRNAELDAKHTIEVEKANIQSDEAQKQQLLAISKGNEKSYQSIIAQKQARAAQIKAALFALRDTAAIPFGQALQYANLASQKTGVRPAYILAILTQESNLGGNVGQCYVTDINTGEGINVKSGNPVRKVMNPTRDVPIFISLLHELGGDYTKTVVSCPQSIGWGGAMGPAQFIPSTWDLLRDQIASMVGISGAPDPWNPQHAIMAAALYLGDRGASAGTYSGERNAACRYYSGQSCGMVSGNSAYGNSVMALADKIQRTMIDPLQGL